MNTIKILGPGCPNCNKTEAIVKSVAEELNCDIKIEKVSDIQEIMNYDIMSTPAIVMDEKVVIKGRVPSKDEIRKLLENTCCSDSESSCCSDSDSASFEEKTETIPSPCCGGTEVKKSDNCC